MPDAYANGAEDYANFIGAGAPRFVVVGGSQSAHCCFEATVVDTTKPVMIGGEHWRNQFEPVCECLDEKDASRIAAVLNLAAKGEME